MLFKRFEKKNDTEALCSLLKHYFKVSFDFTGSLTSHIGNVGCACVHVFQTVGYAYWSRYAK